MTRILTAATFAALAVLPSSPLRAQAARDLASYLIADRAAEVTLARSAAPKHVSDSATILVMTRQGYSEAVRGTNGFTCLVVRPFAGAMDTLSWGNTRVRAPHCLNGAAVRTVLPEIVFRTNLVLRGTPALEIIRRTAAALASGELPGVVEAGAMAYMLSREQYLADEAPQHWKPHVMFYLNAESGAPWGAAGMEAPVIFGGPGVTAKAIVIFIPVPQWSDGTAAAVHEQPRQSN
jgi:hypothetical protein